ncbi:SufB/SufD family protein [Acuticoccus mangrovi]|uniref:SufB/SufD family protein n=1 Tax=Acuticoccus mangrovi TaxID=2796142 RepID=UPI001E3E1A7F|nr:SufD family Fe-S cluster assembly protein [Acuticoccus mangrovi]
MSAAQTEAERTLAALFESRSASFTKAPIDAARADAFRRFAANGLPHRRVEAYKYTDLKARLRRLPEPAGPADNARVAATLAAHPPLQEGATRVLIANGRYHGAIGETIGGIRIASLLGEGAETEGVGTLVAASDDPLTLANVGLFEGGVSIHVDAPSARPLEIVHVANDESLVMGRIAVFVAPGASANVVERVIGGRDAVLNTLAELTIAEGARVDWIRIADGASEASTDLSSLHVRVAERGRLEHLTVSTGLGLARAQAFAHVAGDEADVNFRAATVAIGKRHADNTLVLRHDALNSTSSEVFRSAVGDGGTAIVQGRILVAPGAQKTDARMMSNALFLDETGEVVNKPELEIFADDVQCGHGATSGDLDEEMVFYLRARGVPEVSARRLLAEAFVVEALERVTDEALQDKLADHLRGALDVMGGKTWS